MAHIIEVKSRRNEEALAYESTRTLRAEPLSDQEVAAIARLNSRKSTIYTVRVDGVEQTIAKRSYWRETHPIRYGLIGMLILAVTVLPALLFSIVGLIWPMLLVLVPWFMFLRGHNMLEDKDRTIVRELMHSNNALCIDSPSPVLLFALRCTTARLSHVLTKKELSDLLRTTCKKSGSVKSWKTYFGEGFNNYVGQLDSDDTVTLADVLEVLPAEHHKGFERCYAQRVVAFNGREPHVESWIKSLGDEAQATALHIMNDQSIQDAYELWKQVKQLQEHPGYTSWVEDAELLLTRMSHVAECVKRVVETSMQLLREDATALREGMLAQAALTAD